MFDKRTTQKYWVVLFGPFRSQAPASFSGWKILKRYHTLFIHMKEWKNSRGGVINNPQVTPCHITSGCVCLTLTRGMAAWMWAGGIKRHWERFKFFWCKFCKGSYAKIFYGAAVIAENLEYFTLLSRSDLLSNQHSITFGGEFESAKVVYVQTWTLSHLGKKMGADYSEIHLDTKNSSVSECLALLRLRAGDIHPNPGPTHMGSYEVCVRVCIWGAKGRRSWCTT